MKPTLSILVVTYNSEQHIDSCLDALPAGGERVPFEVIVADSASTDATRDKVVAHDGVRLFALTDNLGFGAAVNVAASHARGDFLLLLNGDTAVRPKSLRTLLDTAYRERDAGVIGPRIVRANGRPELSFGDDVCLRSESRRKLLAKLVRWHVPGANRHIRRATSQPSRPDWVSGACALVPRKVFKQVGGMDEGFFMYFEDVDLCARVRAAGFAVLFEPAAEVEHVGGASVRTNDHRVRVEYRRSQIRFYAKHRPHELARLRRALKLKFRLRKTSLSRAERAVARDVLLILRDDPEL